MLTHNYTKDQRSRMATKLASMSDGEDFLLNKNEPGRELEVVFTRRKRGCTVKARTSGLVIAKSPTETGLVGEIIYALQNWDRVLNNHLAMLALAQRHEL